MKSLFRLAAIFAIVNVAFVSATIINIPDDYPTIQQGIDASIDGDTVLVQTGTYVENLIISRKGILMGSLFLTTSDSSYIYQTIIDGAGLDPVIWFVNGGIYRSGLIGFSIRNGRAYNGGGIICNNSNLIISNNIICNNRADVGNLNRGGGIYCTYSMIEICGNVIRDNQAYNSGGSAMGGGIYINECDAVIKGNLVINNSAIALQIAEGGGIGSEGDSVLIINNTVCNNEAFTDLPHPHIPGLGGGISCRDSGIIINSIVWGNSTETFGQIWGNSIIVNYCDVQYGYDGEGNIDADPMFVDPENGDFHLLAGSPCIDAGDPDLPLDPDSTRADIGAFYFDQTVGVGDIVLLPSEYYLKQNYPNPFNLSTTISFDLPERSNVIIDIYDILGRKVTTVLDAYQQAGSHQVIWHADDLPSGMYFYKLQSGEYSESKRMVLIK